MEVSAPVAAAAGGALPVLHLVPRLPPVPDGVGNYAVDLARGLAAHGVASRFLVTDPGDRAAAAEPPAVRLVAPAAAALAAQLAASGAATLLVHYVNYAYQRRGCPRWLVDGVGRWRRGAAGRRLVTMFHEVYASGPPWRSSFWLSPVQRRLAARLLRASDAAATSLPRYRRILERWGPAGAVLLAPIVSAVGEPPAGAAATARAPRLVVFGGAGNRRRAYRELAAELTAACRALGIHEIADVGPPLAELPVRAGGVPVHAHGTLPAAEVGAILAGSRAGFVAYPAGYLGKSGVFAAYCAHGVVPVCCWPGGQEHTGADAPPPFWDAASAAPPPDFDACAAAARRWYDGHCLAREAAWFAALLGGGPA